MIETVLFDLGNVLVHFSHERMFAQMGALCGRSGPEIAALCRELDLNDRFERGEISESEFHRALERAVGRPIDRHALYLASSDIFWLNDSMVPVVRALRSSGRRLVLLSNTTAPHLRFVGENFTILDELDEQVVSFKVGAMKPDAPIYYAALDRIGCPPDRCLYVDDLAENIEAGRRFGLDAEVFTDTASFLGHLRQRGVELPPC